MKKSIRGKVWKFKNNVDTDQIIPAQYLVTADPKELGKHAFERVRPEFARKAQKGNILVAGENFGCGSSREHAPLALMGCGIACVIAKSFARIFFRNSINLGLPLIECTVSAKDNDILEVDFAKGMIRNMRTRKSYSFKPMPPFLMKLLNEGLVNYVRSKTR